jgi:hypothetical protein
VRKTWVVALSVVVLSMVGLAAAPRPPERATEAPSVVVASAEDARPVLRARTLMGQPGSESIPGALPLVFVGSLLLGLGAAVRRTT